MIDKLKGLFKKKWILITFIIVLFALIFALTLWGWIQGKNELLPKLKTAASFLDAVMKSRPDIINTLIGLAVYALFALSIITSETLLVKLMNENSIWKSRWRTTFRYLLIALRCLLYIIQTIFYLWIGVYVVSSLYQNSNLNSLSNSYVFTLIFCIVIGVIWIELKTVQLIKERGEIKGLEWLVNWLKSREEINEKCEHLGSFAILSVIVTVLVLADTANSLAFPVQPSEPAPTTFTIDASTFKVSSPEDAKNCKKEEKDSPKCQDNLNYVLSAQEGSKAGDYHLYPKVEKKDTAVILNDDLISKQTSVTNNTQDFLITGKYQEKDHSKIDITVSPGNKGYLDAYLDGISFKFLIIFVSITLGYLKLLMEAEYRKRKANPEDNKGTNQDKEKTQDLTEPISDELTVATPVSPQTLISTYGDGKSPKRGGDKVQEQEDMPSLRNTSSPANTKKPMKNGKDRVWKALSLVSFAGFSYLIIKETKRNKNN